MAGRPHLRRLAWRHPEWWTLVLSAGAWISMFRPHAHHAHPLTSWLVMTLAMMLPMVVDPVRTTAERSLWRRRHRAMALFLFSYVGCWMLAGLAASFITISHPFAPAIAFSLAGAWQLTRFKRLSLVACHRTRPLAPRGWRADRDCLLYGATIARSCVTSCWALMLACSLAGHSLPATLFVTAIALTERYTARPDQRLLSAALFGAALWSGYGAL